MTKFVVTYVDINSAVSCKPFCFHALFDTREAAQEAIKQDMEEIIAEYEEHNEDAPEVERSEDGMSVDLNSEESVVWNICEIELPDAPAEPTTDNAQAAQD